MSYDGLANAGLRLGRAKGGVARAEALSPGERSEIAKKAAAARWSLPRTIREGAVKIGEVTLQCAVLEDGRRVLTQSDVMLALGRARQVKSRKYFDADVNLPAFLQAKNLKPFISNDLAVTSSRIEFLTSSGTKAFGYQAELLPNRRRVLRRRRIRLRSIPGGLVKDALAQLA